MLIEFIGLPGSGKTTYLEKLKHQNDAVIDRESLEKINLPFGSFIKYAFKNKTLFFIFSIGILYNFDVNIKRWYALIVGVRATLQQFSKIDNIQKTKSNNYIIMDEGLLQRSLSIFYFKARKWNPFFLKKAIKIILKMNLINEVVYLNIEPSVSIKRCLNRPTGLPFRYKKFSTESLIAKFNNTIKGIQIIKDNCATKFTQIN